MKRQFEGIWIPREIWLAKDLSLQEKVFLVEIRSLDNEEGCYANNEYFSKFFGISKTRVSMVINSLVEKGYVTSYIKVEEGNKRILKTLLNFSLRPSLTNLKDPLKQSFKHNNTFSNTANSTENSTENKKKTPKGADVSKGSKQNKWMGTGLDEEPPTYVSGQQKKEKEKGSAQKEKEESHDTKTESSLSDLPQGRVHGAVAVQEEHNQLEHAVSDLDSAGQATGQAQPLAEDLSQRQWEKRYKDAWWDFYKVQKNNAEPPNSWRNHYTFGGPLKEIQQDLAAEFGGNEEKAYQEFVSILSGWQHPKNYHRHRLKPKQIHNHLEEIRGIINEDTGKISGNINKIPVLGEALEIFREAHLEQRQFYPSISEQYDLPQLGKTLEYLRSLQPDATWEDALQLFTFICNKWPDLERQDEFYAQHFTIRYIHGNTSKIINLLKSGAKKQPDLSPAAAAAWLARNGVGAQR